MDIMTIAIIVVILIVILVSMYNYLIRLKNQVDNIYSNVDVILKKRYDLLPNLFEVTKSIMTHERALFEEVTKLRSEALKTNDANNSIKLAKEIQNPLQNIIIAFENYPVLKSNQNVLILQKELVEVEDRISAARRAYNQSVTDFNNALQMFPTNIMASFMKLKTRELYSAPDIVINTKADELIK